MNFIENIFKDIADRLNVQVVSVNEIFVAEAKKIIEKYNLEVEFDSGSQNMLISGGDESSQRECNNELICLMNEVNETGPMYSIGYTQG